jgi:hypothetical protein
MIHEMGSQVMPFDLTKTKHVFEMTETGGIQKVIVRDEKDVDQLAPIRQHLMHESMRFSEGDFFRSDFITWKRHARDSRARSWRVTDKNHIQ